MVASGIPTKTGPTTRSQLNYKGIHSKRPATNTVGRRTQRNRQAPEVATAPSPKNCRTTSSTSSNSTTKQPEHDVQCAESQHRNNTQTTDEREKCGTNRRNARMGHVSGEIPEKKKTQRAIARRQSSCHSPTVTNKDGCVEQRLRAAQHLRNPRPGDQTPPTTS